jgi:predicted Holliday junction resolvase-like endonuclease
MLSVDAGDGNRGNAAHPRGRGVSGSGVVVLLGLLVAVVVIALSAATTLFATQSRQLQSRLTEQAQRSLQLQSRLDDQIRQYTTLQSNLNNHAQHQFETWRDRELEAIRTQFWKAALSEARNTFVRWQAEAEESIRADAIARSSAVVRGKVTEHLTPYLGVFPYNPKDVRFLGSPVDLIVFDGMNENDLREIIFLEIKTGSSTMSTRERRIRDIVQARQVSWREFRVAAD